MPTTVAKILLMLAVGLVVSIGFYIRPHAKRPVPIWQLTSVFVLGVLMGAIMLTTHSLYISGKA